MKQSHFPKAVLFDLDGTLLDSAPDMLATVNAMRLERGIPPMPLAGLRPHVSRGARAMAAAAFPLVDAQTRETWIPEFLERYSAELGRHGKPFDGVEELLAAIEDSGSRWGIVTNKPEYLAQALLPLLGWQTRCAVMIGGDTLPVRKPDPLPLTHAAGVLGVPPSECVYVGDDERDIQAARAAGMRSIVALWGYRLPDDDPAAWGGDAMAATAWELLAEDVWLQP